jgi:hypothetical protein
MVARPVPAARGHFARKARPETAGYEWATRAASASLPRAGGTGATSISSSERPVTIRATLPAGTNPVRSPSGHRRGASQLRTVRPCMVVYGRSASAIPGAELHLFSEEGHLSLVYGREREILDRLAQQLAVTTDPKPPGRA